MGNRRRRRPATPDVSSQAGAVGQDEHDIQPLRGVSELLAVDTGRGRALQKDAGGSGASCLWTVVCFADCDNEL